MDFRDDVDLDASQVEEGGGGFPGGGLAIGGGAIGVVALVVALLLGVNPADLLSGGGSSSGGSTGARPASDLSAQCKKGSDADQSEKCRVVGVVNSVQAYWRDAFAERGKEPYRIARTVLFTNAVSTGCGQASSAVGPFYCPADSKVYLDLGFFAELESQFGAKGGPFAQAYVIGHEYGHHVQNLLGTTRRVGGGSQGSRQRLRTAGASGRLLRGSVGEERGRHGVLREPVHRGGHQGGAGRRGGRRRRQDPAAHPRQGGPRGVDTR